MLWSHENIFVRKRTKITTYSKMYSLPCQTSTHIPKMNKVEHLYIKKNYILKYIKIVYYTHTHTHTRRVYLQKQITPFLLTFINHVFYCVMFLLCFIMLVRCPFFCYYLIKTTQPTAVWLILIGMQDKTTTTTTTWFWTFKKQKEELSVFANEFFIYIYIYIYIYSQVHKYWDIDTILTFLALYTTTMDFKWNEQDVL